MIAFVVALFLVPIGYYLSGNEVTQWRAASTIRKYESGDKATAIEELTALVEKSKAPRLDMRLIVWLKDEGRLDEAIVRCEKSEVPRALLGKAECLILQKKHKAAMASVLAFFGSDTESSSLSLEGRNEFAYYRGLCGQDLRSAISDINSVYRDIARRDLRRPMTFQGQVAVAAGLISRYTDQREYAAEMILNRLADASDELQSVSLELNSRLYLLMQSFFDLSDLQLLKSNLSRERSEQLQNEIVALKSVLALLLDDLGETSQSLKLRRQVSQAGVTCEEVLESMPGELVNLDVLRDGAAYIDTRGYILYRLGEYEKALAELDLAILAIDVRSKSFDSDVYNSTSLFFDESERDLSRKQRATLYNHRMLIHEAMNHVEAAERDRQRVIELGFKPGPDLF